MKLLSLWGVFEDDNGDRLFVPLKLNGVKKLNSKTVSVSVLLRIVDGVKRLTDGLKNKGD